MTGVSFIYHTCKREARAGHLFIPKSFSSFCLLQCEPFFPQPVSSIFERELRLQSDRACICRQANNNTTAHAILDSARFPPLFLVFWKCAKFIKYLKWCSLRCSKRLTEDSFITNSDKWRNSSVWLTHLFWWLIMQLDWRIGVCLVHKMTADIQNIQIFPSLRVMKRLMVRFSSPLNVATTTTVKNSNKKNKTGGVRHKRAAD